VGQELPLWENQFIDSILYYIDQSCGHGHGHGAVTKNQGQEQANLQVAGATS